MSEKQARRKHSVEFKAKVLAELGQATVVDVAKKHGLARSLIDRWKSQAGMSTPRAGSTTTKKKRRAGRLPRVGRHLPAEPTPEMQVAFALLAKGKTLKQAAKKIGTTTGTLGRWATHYRKVAAAANGAPNGVSKPAARNGAAQPSALRGIGQVKAMLSDMITQLDAVETAFEAFTELLGDPFAVARKANVHAEH